MDTGSLRIEADLTLNSRARVITLTPGGAEEIRRPSVKSVDPHRSARVTPQVRGALYMVGVRIDS